MLQELVRERRARRELRVAALARKASVHAIIASGEEALAKLQAELKTLETEVADLKLKNAAASRGAVLGKVWEVTTERLRFGDWCY